MKNIILLMALLTALSAKAQNRDVYDQIASVCSTDSLDTQLKCIQAMTTCLNLEDRIGTINNKDFAKCVKKLKPSDYKGN